MKEKYKHLFDICSGRPIVIFGGRLGSAKGADSIYEAIKIVKKSVPNILLVIVGEINTYAQELKDQANEEGMADNVLFTGLIPNEDMHYIYELGQIK